VKTKPHFDFAWAACPYNDPLKHLIHQYKYNQRTYLREFFARLMVDFVRAYHLDIQQFDSILPVPLHSTRLRERGYNQSQLLAERVAEEYHINLSTNNLIRARHTEHQTLLNEKERWTNIHEAFRIRHPTEVSRKNILVIDDLLTTGATASETARALKNAGAGTVGVFTLAITY
jgi:ComF family protein